VGAAGAQTVVRGELLEFTSGDEGLPPNSLLHNTAEPAHPNVRSTEASSTAGDQVGAAGAQTVVRGELLEFTSKSEGGWKPP